MHKTFSITAILLSLTLAPASALALINTTLAWGDSGDAVVTLQGFLNTRGYFSAPASGFFGTKTEDAVIAFQKKEGISPASGIFGPLTRSRINALIAASSTPLTTPKAPAVATSTTAKSAATSTAAKVQAKPIRAHDVLLTRVEYIAKRDYIEQHNYSLLLRANGYLNKQQDFIRTFGAACTGECYATSSSLASDIKYATLDARTGVQNEQYALATLVSYHDRLARAFAVPQYAAAAMPTTETEAALDSVAPKKTMDNEVNGYEAYTSSSAYLKRATSYDARFDALIKKYDTLKVFKSTHDALVKERSALDTDSAAWETAKKNVSCTATLTGDDFKSTCTSATAASTTVPTK